MVAPANPRGTPAAPRSHLTVTARRRRLIQVHLSCRIYHKNLAETLPRSRAGGRALEPAVERAKTLCGSSASLATPVLAGRLRVACMYTSCIPTLNVTQQVNKPSYLSVPCLHLAKLRARDRQVRDIHPTFSPAGLWTRCGGLALG